MIYIHKLEQLMPAVAEIESVPLIRDIKRETRFPITEQQMRERFSGFFVRIGEVEMMQGGLQQIQPAIDEIQRLLERRDADFEGVNLLRTLKLVSENPSALYHNIHFAQQILEWREEFVREITEIFNKMPELKTQEEKLEYNERLNKGFERILRSKEFCFKFEDLVHEMHVEHLNDLKTILPQGYLFKITVEEDLNKVDFSVIRKRIPRSKLDISERILQGILEVKKGVDAAYKINMRMIELAVLLYAYVKFLARR